MNRSSRTALGPSFREGGRLLWLSLLRLGWTQARLAEALTAHLGHEVTAGTVHPWLYGDSAPSQPHREAIAAVMAARGRKVPAGSWSEAARKPFDLAAERDRVRRGSTSAAA